MIPEDIKFFQNPMTKELLINKIRMNPSLKRVFVKKRDVTDLVNQDISQRVNGLLENYVTIFILGLAGSMKSSLLQNIGTRFDKSFSAKSISFLYESFKKLIEESKSGEFKGLDEDLFASGLGTGRIVEEMQNLIETVRKSGVSFIIASPSMKYLEESSFIYILETIDTALVATCPHNLEFHEPRNCICFEEKNCDIKRCFIRAVVKTQGIYLGFYIVEVDWNNDLWKEYGIEKDKFVKSVKEGKIHNQNYKSIAEEIIDDQNFDMYKKTKKGLKLLLEQKYPQLTVSETDMVAEQIRVLQRMEENKTLEATEDEHE